jgi:hypothetical protein
MEDDENRRITQTAQPMPAASSDRAGFTRQREDKRFSGFEDLDWRDNELHTLDFLDIDEEEEEARAERRPHASSKLPEDMPAAVNVSNVVPEPLEAGEEGPFNKRRVAANGCSLLFNNLLNYRPTHSTGMTYGIFGQPEYRHLPDMLWSS